MLNYSKKSWHAILYRSSYDSVLPDNICAYFWKVLFATIMFPIAYLGHLINLCLRDYVFPSIWTPLHIILAVFIGYVSKQNDKKDILFSFWYDYLHGMFWIIIFFIVVIIVVLIFAAIEWLRDYYQEKRDKKWYNEYKKGVIEPYVEKTENPLIVGFKAWKGKYCSKINWS